MHLDKPLAARAAARAAVERVTRLASRFALFGLWLAGAAIVPVEAAAAGCLSDCRPRIGVVSAFGQEAELLLAQTQGQRRHTINGNRFTTGRLRGNPVVIVLSGVSMINAAMVTQLMVDHFKIERLVMTGIAGGLSPDHHIGDVIVPERWAMPMELYWHHDASTPTPCGPGSEVSCLGMKLAGPDGRPLPAFSLPGGTATGWFVRENRVMTATSGPQGEFKFDYDVDPQMLAVARRIAPVLARCGPKAAAAAAAGAEPDSALCVKRQPQLVIGGRGVSGTAFLANPDYRVYLAEQLQAKAVDMETAALAQVAHANRIPYLAIRSLSDLAGAQAFDADVAALFSSGLAEANEAAVTLAFLDAWRRRGGARSGRR